MTPRMVQQTEIKGKLRKHGAVIDATVPLILGFVAYIVAAVSTFSIPQLTLVGLDPLRVILARETKMETPRIPNTTVRETAIGSV